MSDTNTPTYTTTLTPDEQTKFEAWKLKNAPNDPGTDYDLQGAFKAGLSPAENGHFPDTFKKPNHMTFSTESQYSTPDNPGGSWIQNPDKTWTFQASPTNLKYHTPQELQDYFSTVEKGNKLVLPSGTDLAPEHVHSFVQALKQTWPAKAVEGFVDALKLPGDVYAGKVNPESDEGIKRAANFALLFGTGGMDAVNKETALATIKKTGTDVMTSPLDLDRMASFINKIRSGLGT